MELIVVSFLAGCLTVLAPCILPLLPIIVGSSALEERAQPLKPYIIAGSLGLSVLLFTLLLQASTTLLGVPPIVWRIFSGGLIIGLGITMAWPGLWEHIAAKLNIASGKLLGKAGKQKGVWRHVATGAALGPVFSSCSPTYAFIVAAVLPQAFGKGLSYLIAYAVGLSAVLLAIGLAGQSLVSRLGWAANPKGWFKRGLGAIFAIVGVAILFGLDKNLQSYVIDQGWYAPIEHFEQNLR